ncbi:MAG: outer membrane protein assembly factor BamB [Burkholderiales bacterium]|nr:outer membrane protein assembly factor BamB [Burkholderiales bacterium]
MSARAAGRGRHAASRAAWFAALVLVAGCSGGSRLNPLNWWGGAPTGPQPTPLQEIKATLAIGTAWRAAVGSAGNYYFAPAVADGLVFAAGADGTLAAFSVSDGAQRWRISANRLGLSAGVGAGENTVVVGTIKGEVLAFDATGREKWKAQVSSEVLAPPLVSDGMVLVRSNDNRVHAFAAADGRRRWTYQRTAPALVLRNFSGLTAGGGAVFAGFAGGRLVALNASNGSLRWEGTVALPRGATELERIADVTGVPVLVDRTVCATAYQGRTACFDVANGQPLWTRDVASQAGLSVDARYAFVSDERSALVGLSAATGSSLWRQERLQWRGISAPLSIGRAVVVGDSQGVVHAMAREDGSFIGRAATDGGWIAATPALIRLPGGEGLLVQTRTGGLFAFNL